VRLQDGGDLAARLASIGLNGNAWHVTARSGFEAVAYQKGNEVVIAITGWAPLKSVASDAAASLGLFNGSYVDRLRDAALYYAAIKEAMPNGTEFSFTGHSLGGGLAALLAVYFDEPAVVFDQAPFREAALTNLQTDIVGSLAEARLGRNAALEAYTVGEDARPGGLVRGEQNVRSVSVESDVLHQLFAASRRLGQQEPIDLDGAVVAATGGLNLHSIDLLALLKSGPVLTDRIAAIPGLLPSPFDEKLFATSIDHDKPDFLGHDVGVSEMKYAHGDGLYGSILNERTDTGTWYLRDGLTCAPDLRGAPGPQPDVLLGGFDGDRFERSGGGADDMIIGDDGDDLVLDGAGSDYLNDSNCGNNWQLKSGPRLPPAPAEGPERSRCLGWEQASRDFAAGKVRWNSPCHTGRRGFSDKLMTSAVGK